jgi:hypothetical protein
LRAERVGASPREVGGYCPGTRQQRATPIKARLETVSVLRAKHRSCLMSIRES